MQAGNAAAAKMIGSINNIVEALVDGSGLGALVKESIGALLLQLSPDHRYMHCKPQLSTISLATLKSAVQSQSIHMANPEDMTSRMVTSLP